MRDSADVLTDPAPRAADARIAYGPEPLQFGDLRVPPGDGPFPLALVLHGGYWQAMYNLVHTGHLCEGLHRHLRADLRADRAHRPGLLHGDQAVGLLAPRRDGLEVERAQRAQVDHLRLDAFPGQLLGGSSA